ncbi:alcohol dehydrogenase [Diaporthe eres]|uniref:GroES-like protein n=1 Tax=Diaporthe vaccinii TaxID=105482 RepID=A0ABR4EXQ6_9PEZI|nr:alcohol dehydrogenase [Diaporthe eres]
MRGVAMIGAAYNVSVLDFPRPVLQNTTDAIVRITAAAICGSDLHFYHEASGSPSEPFALGHEAIGYIDEIGAGVQSLSVGQYVIVPDNTDDGHYTSGPDLPNSFAEYVRVPYADSSLIPVPVNASTSNETLYDYLVISDVFATGWKGLEYAGFETGDTVAVFGAGAVGLSASYAAILRGASGVYTVDRVQARLDLAASIGAIPINYEDSDPVAQIMALEPNGVTRSVDAVGFEARNAAGEVQSTVVLDNTVAVTRQYGGIGMLGVYGSNQTFPVGAFWGKGLTMGSGIVLPLQFADELVQLVSSGRASPHFVVSASIGIEDAPEYYSRFDRHEESKVVIRFP